MSSTRLFVGNLPDVLSETDLNVAFSNYGQVLNVDFKNKSGTDNQKKFAFVTLSASNYEVESCIKHFSSEVYGGNKLFVTRARESFLERLQRERQEALRKEEEIINTNEPKGEISKKIPVIKLSEKLNPHKRKHDISSDYSNKSIKTIKPYENKKQFDNNLRQGDIKEIKNTNVLEKDKKKQDADKKRIESIKKKRQEFNEKKKIIKSGFSVIDKIANKKVIFSDTDEENNSKTKVINKSKIDDKKSTLFDDDDSDDNVNFEIKKQFEGIKGQKVLDLQSKYKSDKRFVLDERFIEDGQSDKEIEKRIDDDDRVDLGDADEKTKQLNILQDVLGVSIKARTVKPDIQKSKMGMLRFDPTHPGHAKFMTPIEKTKPDLTKKQKNKQLKENKEEHIVENGQDDNKPKIEVSKEQFFKVSETLKEALEQPAAFSLRSLFGQNEDNEKDVPEQETAYIPLEKPKNSKIKNPLDHKAKNPFVYDSSESEAEEDDKEVKKPVIPEATEIKAVWKENLFFSKIDSRLQEALAFFNKTQNHRQKERRELKSVMKKRIYNRERKTQMFQNKIGGRKKSMKKSYRKKS